MSVPSHVDRPSIQEIVAAHQARIWRYLRFLGCANEDAEDLLQDTFVTALRKPFEYRDPQAATNYLRSIARNLFLKRTREHGRKIPHVELDAAEEVWGELAPDDDGGDNYALALRECLAGMGQRSRRALELRYREERGRDAIATDLGISAHGVKSLLRRAREALRSCIESKLSGGVS